MWLLSVTRPSDVPATTPAVSLLLFKNANSFAIQPFVITLLLICRSTSLLEIISVKNLTDQSSQTLQCILILLSDSILAIIINSQKYIDWLFIQTLRNEIKLINGEQVP